MKTNNTMKAIIATGYGGPEMLKLSEVQKPGFNDYEVLVKIVASSATAADCMMRSGKPYIGRLFTGLKKPKHAIPGTGFSGFVVSVGEKVQSFKIGDDVFGETTLGFSTNAEYVAIPETGVILHKPENLKHHEACSICDGFLTSIHFLKNIAKIKKGHKVLINGASGSLGTAAIQLAKLYGAEVTGICSSRNIGLVKSLGADFVVDYTTEDFTAYHKKYDIIYDTVGKLTYTKTKHSLTDKGKFISPVLTFSIIAQMLKTKVVGQTKVLFGATGMLSETQLRSLLGELISFVKDGKIKTVIDRQYPLEKLAEAHKYIASGHKKGNVIIINQSNSELLK